MFGEFILEPIASDEHDLCCIGSQDSTTDVATDRTCSHDADTHAAVSAAIDGTPSILTALRLYELSSDREDGVLFTTPYDQAHHGTFRAADRLHASLESERAHIGTIDAQDLIAPL